MLVDQLPHHNYYAPLADRLRQRGEATRLYATKRGVRQDGLPRSGCPLYRLEQELEAKLHYARTFPSLQYHSERAWKRLIGNEAACRPIREISVGIRELRMVEQVVELSSELRIPALTDRGLFRDHEIRVADGRSAAQRVRYIAEHTRWRRIGRSRVSEIIRVEVNVSMRLGFYELDGAIYRRSVGILKEEAALEFAVVLIFDADREPALVGNDGGQLPAIHRLPRKSFMLRNRKFPHRTEYEPVFRAEQRQTSSGVKVQRIQLLFEGRALVDCFAEGIGRLEQKSVRVVFLNGHLQSVVVRIGDSVFSEYVAEYRNPIRRTANSSKRLAVR